MLPPRFTQRPYIDWRLDRWKLLVMALLFLGLLLWALFTPA